MLGVLVLNNPWGSLLSSYFFVVAPKPDELWLAPEKSEGPEFPNNPPVYFFSPKVGAGVFPNKDPWVFPKLKVGFYLLVLVSEIYFLSWETPENNPPLMTGFLSYTFGVIPGVFPK